MKRQVDTIYRRIEATLEKPEVKKKIKLGFFSTLATFLIFSLILNLFNWNNTSAALANFTYSFNTTADGWTGNGGTSTTDSYQSAAGNPAGALQSSITGRNQNNATAGWYIAGMTWEDLGVPVGAEINSVNGSYDWRCSNWNVGNTTSNSGELYITDSGGGNKTTLESPLTFSGTTAWATRDAGGYISVPAAIAHHDSAIIISLIGTLRTASNAAANVTRQMDNIYLSIDYTLPTVTVGATGTQTLNLQIPSNSQHIGGAFTFVRDLDTTNITQIKVTDTGTVDASTNLSNLKLYYETAATCSYDGTETLFGTATTFTSEVATVTGTMAVGTSQVCVYPVLDVGSGATAGQTIELEISDPSSEVLVVDGIVTPNTLVAINGTTTLQTPPILTVSSSGTQSSSMDIPSTSNYIGAAFTMSTDYGTVQLEGLAIKNTGTVNADSDLSNVRLYYEPAAICSYDGNESEFSQRGFDFSQNEVIFDIFVNEISIGTSQVCFYLRFDVDASATAGQTIEIEITNPSTDVFVTGGTVAPATTVALNGTTTLQAPSVITVSGTSNLASGVVALAINANRKLETGSISGGIWVINDVPQPIEGDVITVWIDGVTDANESTAVTKYLSGITISGMVLNQNVFSVGSDDNQSLTVANLGLYDYDSGSDGGDENVMHTANSSVLKVEGGANSYSDETISILPGNTLIISETETLETHNLGNGGTLSSGGNSTYTVSGSWNNTGTFSASSSTVTFTSIATETLNSGGIGLGNHFYNLIHSGSGELQLSTYGIDVQGNFQNTGGIFNTNGQNQNFAGNFTLGSGATYTKGGTLTFDGNTNYNDFTATIQNIGTVIMSGSSVTLLSSMTVDTLNVSTGTFTLGNSGYTLKLSGTGVTANILTITGDLETGTNSIVHYVAENSGGDVEITPLVYNRLYIGGGSATENYVAAGDLTIFNLNIISSTGTNTFNASNKTVTITGTGAPITVASTEVFVAGTSTFRFIGDTVTTNIRIPTNNVYYNLEVGGSETTNTYVITSNVVIEGSLNIIESTGTNTLDGSTRLISFRGSGTPFIIADSEVFFANASTVQYIGTSGSNVTGTSYYNLNIGMTNTTATYTAAGDITVGGVLQILSSTGTNTFNASSKTITLTGNATSFLINPTEVFIASTSTIIYQPSATAGVTIASATYNNLVLNKASNVFSLQTGGITATGDITIAAGTLDVVNGSNFPISISGNWTNNGAFEGRSGTVTFNGAGGSTQTITGNTTFYNFNAATTSARTLNFASASTTSVSGLWTITGASGQHISLGREGGTGTDQWSIDPATWDVDYVTPSNSNNLAATAINPTNYTDGGNNTNWFSVNNNPNIPTNLTQKNDWTLADIPEGGWLNYNTPRLGFTLIDPDGDDLTYRIQVDLYDTFSSPLTDYTYPSYLASGTTTYRNSSAYSDFSSFYWRVKAIDEYGAESDWIEFGVTGAVDFRIDATPPSGGTVNDGQISGGDLDWNTDGSLSQYLANWTATPPNSNISGLLKYEYAIRRSGDNYYWTPGSPGSWGATEYWYDNGTNTSFTVSNLNLQTGTLYYVSLKTTDNAGNTATINSNGLRVTPTLSFAINSNLVEFSSLKPNDWTDSKTSIITTSTNASGGYIVKAYASDFLRSINYVSEYIDSFVGTWLSPQAWSGFCKDNANFCGFGYTSNDTNVQGSNRFNSGANFASYTQSSPGDVVADNLGPINGSTGAVTNEQFTLTHKASVLPTQVSSKYQTSIYYLVTANF
jgi:hypothetical protein